MTNTPADAVANLTALHNLAAALMDPTTAIAIAVCLVAVSVALGGLRVLR